jgi:hypothetical protein
MCHIDIGIGIVDRAQFTDGILNTVRMRLWTVLLDIWQSSGW